MYVCYESTKQLREQLNNRPNNKLIQCHRVFLAELATSIKKSSLLVKEREDLLPSMNHTKLPKYIQDVELHLCSSYMFWPIMQTPAGAKIMEC
jgi:hypothetical protein